MASLIQRGQPQQQFTATPPRGISIRKLALAALVVALVALAIAINGVVMSWRLCR